MKNSTLEKLGIATVVGGIVGLLVFLPVIYFALGAFGGWILKVCVGGHVVYGLNVLFGTDRFYPEQLPVICGVLAVIGSYFKSTQTNKSEK